MPRVLIVDDQALPRETLGKVLGLSHPDWDIMYGTDEEHALELVTEHIRIGQPCEVLIADLMMKSEQGGMTLIEDAQKLDPQLMGILVTARSDKLQRSLALEKGAFDVVEKTLLGRGYSREIDLKTCAALKYRNRAQQVAFLSRYFDPQVCNLLGKNPKMLEMKNQLITICFWDIRGFSRWCDVLKQHPDLISGFLEEYFTISAQVVFENSGVLDKFIGDGVMALFGSLASKEDDGDTDALCAVKAAFLLRDRFQALRETWLARWQRSAPETMDISLGCGIHTGLTLVGTLGSQYRAQYTALGPHVNFASRIEARATAGQILLSQSTQARVSNAIETTFVEELDNIKNIQGRFRLFAAMSEITTGYSSGKGAQS